ncbi:12235_t:CDS:10, partial [Gigaspora rosea]
LCTHFVHVAANKSITKMSKQTKLGAFFKPKTDGTIDLDINNAQNFATNGKRERDKSEDEEEIDRLKVKAKKRATTPTNQGEEECINEEIDVAKINRLDSWEEKKTATTKRLEIQELLTTFFVQVIELSPDNLLETLYLCINRICPEYENLELGVGESLLIKAIAETTGRKTSKVKEELAKWGDLGKVAKDSKNTQPTLIKPKPLTIPALFSKMKGIAKTNGQDERKIRDIKFLLTACQGDEAKYLIRSLEGKLRIGLAEQTVLISLAQSIVLKDPGYQKLSKALKAEELTTAADIVKSVYSELPSYDIIVPTLLKLGVRGLRENCKLTP